MTAALAGLREMTRGFFWFLPVVALSGWVMLIAFDQALMLPRLCGMLGIDTFFTLGLPAALAFNSAGTLALSWVLMLTAMTAPLLHRPLAQVSAMSFAERRWRATGLFVTGFMMTWLLAIALLMLCALALRIGFGGSPFLPFLLVLSASIVWQGTSMRQQSLNRCHAFAPLPAFGLAAEWGSMRFGFANARACVGACWPLMLLPFVAGAAHLCVMAGAAIIMFADRYARPRLASTNVPLVLVGSTVILASAAASLLWPGSR